jgi:ABC-2 type transport system ATP-binding protein
MNAIDLRNVAKVYKGRVHALRGIAMEVRRGEIFGLLGPNGAGKSTLVKIMMTVVRPTHAEGTVLGEPIGDKATLRRVGYLPENHRFPRYLTGRQVLEFFAALSNVDRPTRKRRAGELLETVGMTEAADRKISTYSKGMMQRVGLAQALVADPDLVVLDEPTDGVDPVGRRDIRNVLGELRKQNKTVFVNSHLLSELEMICDRVAILVAGQVARHGTIDELTVAKQRYEIEIAATGPEILASVSPQLEPPAPTAPVPFYQGKLKTGQWLDLYGSTLRVGAAEAAEVQGLIDAIRAAGLVIRRVQSVRPSLEELFIDTISVPKPGIAAAPPFPAAPIQPPRVR